LAPFLTRASFPSSTRLDRTVFAVDFESPVTCSAVRQLKWKIPAGCNLAAARQAARTVSFGLDPESAAARAALVMTLMGKERDIGIETRDHALLKSSHVVCQSFVPKAPSARRHHCRTMENRSSAPVVAGNTSRRDRASWKSLLFRSPARWGSVRKIASRMSPSGSALSRNSRVGHKPSSSFFLSYCPNSTT
jgi:hypothetical protein